VVIQFYVKWLANHSEHRFNDVNQLRCALVRIPLLRGNPG
jgi:hypothetical protein